MISFPEYSACPRCCRDAYGIPPIVKMLELSKDNGQASAATDAIRALCLNNSSNKDAVREAWALPLLVKLLSSVSVLTNLLLTACYPGS